MIHRQYLDARGMKTLKRLMCQMKFHSRRVDNFGFFDGLAIGQCQWCYRICIRSELRGVWSSATEEGET